MNKHIALFIGILLSSTTVNAENHLVADSGFSLPPIANCETDLRYLNQVSGWQTIWPQQWIAVVTSGTNSIEQPIEYWSQLPKALATLTQQLQSGIAKNQLVPKPVIQRVYQQIQDVAVNLRAENSPYRFNQTDSAGEQKWNAMINNSVMPAFNRFEHFLRDEYLPKATSNKGFAALKNGEQCFINAATWWTSLNIPPQDIEDMGRRLLKETRDELALTGNTGESVDDILNRLRNHSQSDPTSAEQLIAISEQALKRAHEKTSLAFSHQAGKEIIVKPLPLYMQAAFPAGRYTGSQDNNPASYVINPSRPNERRLMAEVIAFHEGIPGHHLWTTYPRDTTPTTSYSSGLWGLLEGWAIYSEYVADELGLYSTQLDRQGMMTKHLWAASRLVVEPGLHIHGWTREQAIQFMLNNTVLSRTEIEIEVDRYLAMPGQSLSYMFGADLILSERKRAQTLLGDAFDIKAFHDVVLRAGLRPLPVVRDDIRAWANTVKPNQEVQTKKAISVVWTAINENFGGENFNRDQWVQSKQQFVNQDYPTIDAEYAAIESLLETLGEPSVRLLRKDEKDAFLSEIGGQLPAGLGLIELLSIDIDERTNKLTIITCLPDTAAAKAGLRSGDQIFAINGAPTEGLSLAESMSKLRMDSGVEVTLDIRRDNTPMTFTIASESVRNMPSPVRMFTKRLGDKTVGYIHYLIVAEGSAEAFKQALVSLSQQGMDALVLDLRNNPGGAVADALAVADLFLENGAPIVSLRAGQDKIIQEFFAQDPALWDGPIAILQNKGSASAAELIAGALQANERTIIVGQKSYGKGLLHTFVPLEDGAAVMYHIGRLISPDNRDILHEMIDPDYLVPMTPSPVMGNDQKIVGSAADVQYRFALHQLLAGDGA